MRRTDREIKDKDVMTDILRCGDVCHLALVDEGKPYVVALNYGFTWEGALPVFYFHCARKGRKLDIIAHDPDGCLCVDTAHELVRGESDCEWGMKYRSIVGEGTLSIVEDTSERKRGLDLVMAHYSGRSEFQYDEKVFSVTTLLKMELTTISGKAKS